jgi:hypothetical protein
MNIIRALDDPKVFGRYFRAESWAAWRVFLAALFGLPLTPEQLALYRQFTGRSTAPKSPLQEAWLVVGRRGGKSFVLGHRRGAAAPVDPERAGRVSSAVVHKSVSLLKASETKGRALAL